GRAAEVAALTELVEHTRLGAGGLVLVAAESGGGKTRLIDELRRRLGPDVWALHGQGVDQAAARPFQLLEGVAEDVLAAVAEDPERAAAIRERLGDRAGAAAAALPTLAPVLT